MMIFIFILACIVLLNLVLKYFSKKTNAENDQRKKLEFEEFKKISEKLTLPIYDIITNIYSWKEEPKPIESNYYNYYNYEQGTNEFTKFMEERKRRFTNYNYCKVTFEFDYQGVRIKTTRTFNLDKDNLKIKFALQEKIDLYITYEKYVEEELELYDTQGNLIPQENIVYYTDEINYSGSHYYDGEYIYTNYLDLDFTSTEFT